MHFSCQCVIVLVVVATLASSISAAALNDRVKRCSTFCSDFDDCGECNGICVSFSDLCPAFNHMTHRHARSFFFAR
ncbi:hypothetical protein EV702DRAFT_1087586 [Suillus placidus]|uniref:Uncharacterized protein n=1 Tax=Suillus placidus TaxID=48579 RepID=A0A9P7A061_9AGAM|nr:hypothetical protein EV702DRAFT_1087586 [Suillus placidus]